MELRSTSPWREFAGLARRLGGLKWAPLALVALGLLAALAEMTGISIAVMFLFSLLDQSDSLRAGSGVMARAFQTLERSVGADLVLIPAVFIAAIAVNSAILFLYRGLTAALLNRIAERMRDEVHRSFVTIGYRHLQAREHGELLHTLSNETWTASEAVDGISRIAINLCTALVFGMGIFLLSWQIGLAAMIAGAILSAITHLLAKPARRYGELTLTANQVLAERMLVSLNGMRTIRVFGQEPYVLRLFGAASSGVRRLATRSEWLHALVRPIMEVGSVCALVVIVIIARAVETEATTTIAAGLLLFRLLPRLREMQNYNVVLSGLTASMRNVREVLDTGAMAAAPDGARTFQGLEREIRLEKVVFRHEDRASPILDRIDLTIRRGAITALTGPSGSGKTTIVNLLMRLYEPDEGAIRVDDALLSDLTRASWLGRVALAGQDVELIEGTIAQNLRLARHEASLDDMREACAVVEMLEVIEQMPNSFDSPIGPLGLNFSGGQRQRIGLARALIHRPDILILDEALSAVEPALEDRIRKRLRDLMPDRTFLSISHRRDGADWADAVIRLEDGRIVGAGPQPSRADAADTSVPREASSSALRRDLVG